MPVVLVSNRNVWVYKDGIRLLADKPRLCAEHADRLLRKEPPVKPRASTTNHLLPGSLLLGTVKIPYGEA